jgi:hypothetical protein
MRVFEEQGHSALINRTLFDGIQFLKKPKSLSAIIQSLSAIIPED